MANYTVEISLPDHKRGDRWAGITSIGPVIINGAQPELALVRVRMHLLYSRGGLFRLDSDASKNPDALIVIDDPTTWQVHIPPVEKFVDKSGKWAWDMEFYQEGQLTPLTLYEGTLIVDGDITV